MISREVRGLERAMDGLSARFTTQANNIANLNTPNYVRQDVKFEEALAMAIDSEPTAGAEVAQDPLGALFGSPQQSPNDLLELFNPTATPMKGGAMRLDGNGTSLENEMSVMVQTAQKYNAVATQIATQYRTFKFIADAK